MLQKSRENIPRTLVVASNNKHKLHEIRSILGDLWTVISAQEMAPDVMWDETGTTFLENARIKIKALRPYTSGCILADDSGLCVDALEGRPGVWSSSYGGVEGDHARNCAKLLQDMANVPDGKRQAYFICLLVFEDENQRESIYEGRCSGSITTGLEGEGGFGYDPLFYVPECRCTLAALSDSEKNKLSHRGRAMQQFMAAQRRY